MLETQEQIFNQINKAKEVLITFSVEWNADEIASASALFLYLKKMGKKVDVVAKNSKEKEKYKKYAFLPNFDNIQTDLLNLRKFVVSLDISNAKINQIKYTIEENKLNFIVSPEKGFFTDEDISSHAGGFKYDLIITLNTSDLESLGTLYDNNIEFFYKTPIINIDHVPSNEEYGQINLLDLNAVSTTEILFSLFKEKDKKYIDEDIATCLLVGIIYKTKSFKNPNLTPKTLMTTSELINLNARREEIINNLYRSKDIKSLKIWGKILNNLKSTENNHLIWSYVPKSKIVGIGYLEETFTSLIEELISNIPETKIVVLFFENQNKQAQEILLYSIKNINSLDLVREYQPQGTPKIAKINLREAKEESFIKTFLEDLKNKLEKISS